MHRQILYPTYTNNYYYYEGDYYITLERWVGAEVVYKRHLQFDTPEEALEYFETECGA
jgi:hypothetical protein